MSKPKVTRTYGPIHFEDLDPHRFEDLIRELIYDYKDWQSIEATGRSGSDEGFDIRAYEKVEIISPVENEKNEETEEIHPILHSLEFDLVQYLSDKIMKHQTIVVLIHSLKRYNSLDLVDLNIQY